MDTVLLVSPLLKLTMMLLSLKSSAATAVTLDGLSLTLTSPTLPPLRVKLTAAIGVPSS
jgi:hypothetical protein